MGQRHGTVEPLEDKAFIVMAEGLCSKPARESLGNVQLTQRAAGRENAGLGQSLLLICKATFA